MTVRLSNPVVFFTLGNSAGFAQVLSSAIEGYVQGAGFIAVPEEFDDELIRAEVGRVWREFLASGVGKSEIIRANFLINADESAYFLPGLLAYAERFFSTLYPGGVLVDVYCLMNDTDLLTDARRHIMQMLKGVRETAERVYLLSNVTNAVLPPEAMAQTVALLMLFKDCTPGVYAPGADASRYNEFYFLDNCAARSGDFLTAGSLTLEVPREALKALIVCEVLEYGCNAISGAAKPEDRPENPAPNPDLPPKKPVKSMEFLYGLAVPEFNTKDPLTRGMWLSKLFGQRLGKIAADYTMAETEITASPEIKDVYELSRQAGEAENASAALATAEDELQRREENFSAWLGDRPDFRKSSPEAAVRKLSPIQTQQMFPYVLAAEFLKKSAEIQFAKEKVKVMRRRQQTTERFQEKLGGHISETQEAVAERTEQIAVLDEKFAAFTENTRPATEYFRTKFAEFAEVNREVMQKLSKKMAEDLVSGCLPEFISRLEESIEANILRAPQFSEPISVLLRQLVGGENISAAITEWITRQIPHGIRLKTGYAQLYSEANFVFPDAKIAFEVKKIFETRGLGRMNIFPMAQRGVSKLAVMYHAGAFDASELFYVNAEIDDEAGEDGK